MEKKTVYAFVGVPSESTILTVKDNIVPCG